MTFTRQHPARRGFTMLEIALCLAIIAFALVAIIGILPTGINVQKSNREETLINQDSVYLLEAIRSGAQGLDELTNFVEYVVVNGVTNYPMTGREAIGLLVKTNTLVEAKVRAISGAATEQGSDRDIRDISFTYKLQVEVVPFDTAADQLSPDRAALRSRLHELRLTFLWPFLGARGGGKNTGNGFQTYRTLVSGDLVQTNNLFFFRP